MPFTKKQTTEGGVEQPTPSIGVELDNTETLPIPTPVPMVESIDPVKPVIQPITVKVVTQDTPVKVGNDSIPTLIGKALTSKYGIDAAFSVIGSQAAATMAREFQTSFNLILTAIDISRLDIDNGPVIYSSDVDGYLSSFNVNSYFRNNGVRAIYIGDTNSINDLIGVLEATTTRIMHRHKIVRLDLSKASIPGAAASLLKSYPDSFVVRGGGSIVYWISNTSDTFTFTMIDILSVKDITHTQIIEGEFGRVIDVDEM